MNVMDGVLVNLQNIWRQGLMAPIAVIALLGMLILPLPAIALDLFFTINICISIVIVLVSVYSQRPLDFVIFPTIILLSTLFRLALNVASTRIVLMEGHTGTAAAGQVIESFGEFVIGGNYAVGLVVFSILVIINFVVVTKGAGRVSEVSARFTLDAMPGKQMAIDADLNSGIIDQEQAKLRREEIASEADFYGSMDGASKFVRGDAVAGILILIINVVGGFAIGVGQHDMALSDAVRNYTLLTIGDGLVAQIPSLLLSSATAIIITRDSRKQELSEKVKEQMFSNTKVLWVTAAIVGIMGAIPGMPNFAFLSIAGALVLAAKWMDKQQQYEVLHPKDEVENDAPEKAPENKELSWDDVQPVDLIGLEVGYGLIPMVDKNQNGQLLNRIKGVRKKLSQELGFLIHSVHIRDNLDLSPNAYRITLNGVPVGESTIHPDREMAINPGQVYGELQGVPGKDPAYGLDAIWIEPNMRDHAQTLGYTVVDATTVVATHLNQILHDNADELLGHEEVQQLLDNLAAKSPKLIEDLVPKLLPLSVIVKVMQNLLSEGVSVRDVRTIAEVLAENGGVTQNPIELTSIVRIALGRAIVQKINGLEMDLPVITLESSLEQLLLQSAQNASQGSIGVEPGLTERMFKSLEKVAEQQEMSNQPVILVVAPALRLWLSQLVKHTIAGMSVLSYSEIPDNKNIKVVASVGAN